MDLFFEGMVIGFVIAAPVGPIGVLCIRRTLVEGRASGFVSGLGAATADALYGSVAALGLAFVTNLLVGGQLWLRLLGVRTFLSHPAERAAPAGRRGLVDAYAPTSFLTLTNPTTILSFTAIFAGLGLGRVRRLRAVVVDIERDYGSLSRQGLRPRVAVGEQRFGIRHHGLRHARRLRARIRPLARTPVSQAKV